MVDITCQSSEETPHLTGLEELAFKLRQMCRSFSKKIFGCGEEKRAEAKKVEVEAARKVLEGLEIKIQALSERFPHDVWRKIIFKCGVLQYKSAVDLKELERLVEILILKVNIVNDGLEKSIEKFGPCKTILKRRDDFGFLLMLLGDLAISVRAAQKIRLELAELETITTTPEIVAPTLVRSQFRITLTQTHQASELSPVSVKRVA